MDNGKRPALRNWEGVASSDPDQIREWWAGSAYNIGIACGPSGLVVIDLDTARNQTSEARWSGCRDGRDVLARLAAEAQAPRPTSTFTVRTPSGGLHLYFWVSAWVPVRSAAARLGWRVDVRAQGGYVVAAGSALATGRYSPINRAHTLELPDWLALALRPPPPPSRIDDPRPVMDIGKIEAGKIEARKMDVGQPVRRDRYVRAILTEVSRAVRDAPTSNRNQELRRSAEILGRLVANGELDNTTARNALLTSAVLHIQAGGWMFGEVQATINDGIAAGAERSRCSDARAPRLASGQ
jgi:hypothetical protein